MTTRSNPNDTLSEKSSPKKGNSSGQTVSLTVLDGDANGPGPGSSLTSDNSLNLSSIIVQTANEAGNKITNQSSSSPRRSPLKSTARGRSDRPPTNARPASPRKSRTYLDFDGPDSEDELDGALVQVYRGFQIEIIINKQF